MTGFPLLGLMLIFPLHLRWPTQILGVNVSCALCYTYLHIFVHILLIYCKAILYFSIDVTDWLMVYLQALAWPLCWLQHTSISTTTLSLRGRCIFCCHHLLILYRGPFVRTTILQVCSSNMYVSCDTLIHKFIYLHRQLFRPSEQNNQRVDK